VKSSQVNEGRVGSWAGMIAFWWFAVVAALIGAQLLCPEAAAQTAVSAWQDAGSATAPIQVDGWAKPQAGWLYVLDPHPTRGSVGGRIWLLDPKAGKMMGSIVTGADADFALSPDGTRLYVAARGKDQLSNLAVIDTGSGTVVGTETMDGRVVADGAAPYSTMSVSTNGATLRILVNSVNESGDPGFQIHSFDTQSGDEMRGHIHLGNCGYGRFVANIAPDQFDFLCPTTNRLRRISVDAKGADAENSYVVFPWVRRLGIAQAVLSSDGQRLLIARGDAGIVMMDIASGAFTPTREKGEIQGRIPPAAWPLSADGTRLFLGYSRTPNTRFYLDFDRSATDSPRTQTANEFHVFDTRNWRKIATIKTHAPFWAAAAASDDTIYATSPGAILVIDGKKMRQTGAIPCGGSPTLILVAP